MPQAGAFAYGKEIVHVFVHIFYVRLVGETVADTLVQQLLVLAGIEQYGIGSLPVAPRPAGLLEICFGSIRHINVYDAPHIGLVYAHAESIRCHHDTRLSPAPCRLPHVFHFIVQPRMVKQCRYSACREKPANLLATLAAPDIDNGRAWHAIEDMLHLAYLVFGITHHIGQIAAHETHAEYIVRGEQQFVLYVVRHLQRGCGRKSQYRHSRQQFPYLRYLQIGRTEVITPLRNAMSLIYRYHRHLHVPDFLQENLCGQPFGRDIEELETSEYAVFQCHDNLFRRHTRIDRHSLYAFVPKPCHLIFHQGNEGSDHYAHSLHAKRRHLKRDGLASAGGHQPQRVASGTYALYYLALYAAKRIIAPVFLQYGKVSIAHSDGRISTICNCTSPRLWVFSSMV